VSLSTPFVAGHLSGRLAEDILVSLTFLGVSPSQSQRVAGIAALVARFRHADGRNFVGEFDGRLERHYGDVVELNQKSTQITTVITKQMTVKSDGFIITHLCVLVVYFS
jgi:hypothetical protein